MSHASQQKSANLKMATVSIRGKNIQINSKMEQFFRFQWNMIALTVYEFKSGKYLFLFGNFEENAPNSHSRHNKIGILVKNVPFSMFAHEIYCRKLQRLSIYYN